MPRPRQLRKDHSADPKEKSKQLLDAGFVFSGFQIPPGFCSYAADIAHFVNNLPPSSTI
jgi:hypothetical protein